MFQGVKLQGLGYITPNPCPPAVWAAVQKALPGRFDAVAVLSAAAAAAVKPGCSMLSEAVLSVAVLSVAVLSVAVKPGCSVLSVAVLSAAAAVKPGCSGLATACPLCLKGATCSI